MLHLHHQWSTVLPEHQSAYRSCHSTESALLKVTSDALLAADQGEADHSGCSTWVPRSTALAISTSSGDWTYPSALMKMHSNGSSSYITGRRQYVRYNGRTSEISVVECGVPQDSVLGPLYFVLFTADVFGIADEHGFAIHGYADGMQIYDPCVVDDMHHLTSRPVDCIGSIEVWMTNNRLKLNASETEFIWFGSARRLARCTFESIVINDNWSSILPSKTVRNV